jgi:DNA repair photolyase
MKIEEIEVKSILSKSGLPGVDWSINPYVGCQFSCMYCYAVFITKWKHSDEEWGEFLDVKINAPAILRKELERRVKRNKSRNYGSILFSSVTDPYTGAEAKYQLTRKCLEILVDFGYKGEVSILTKSPLVVRDIDLLKKLDAEVGITVTTYEDSVIRFLEGRAPSASARIKALRTLHDEGIPMYSFVGPLLPYFVTREEKLRELFRKLKDAGVNDLCIEHINLTPIVKERLFTYLRKQSPELVPYFKRAETEAYVEKLDSVIYPILRETNLKLTGGGIIHHTRVEKDERGNLYGTIGSKR